MSMFTYHKCGQIASRLQEITPFFFKFSGGACPQTPLVCGFAAAPSAPVEAGKQLRCLVVLVPYSQMLLRKNFGHP